jgi:hypothetical protein
VRRQFTQYLRDNPQALILLLLVIVFAVGTVIALAFSTASNPTSGSNGFGVNDGVILLHSLF